jgi:hypothetical protein
MAGEREPTVSDFEGIANRLMQPSVPIRDRCETTIYVATEKSLDLFQKDPLPLLSIDASRRIEFDEFHSGGAIPNNCFGGRDGQQIRAPAPWGSDVALALAEVYVQLRNNPWIARTWLFRQTNLLSIDKAAPAVCSPDGKRVLAMFYTRNVSAAVLEEAFRKITPLCDGIVIW